jgi:hypothetical protein
MKEENKDLFYLHDLSDYKVADDYPDVRDWKVRDLNNRNVGNVDGLLVSKSAERVVYLDVEVDKSIIEEGHETYGSKVSEGVHEFINEDGDTHLIIPIGLVSLDEEHKIASTTEIDSDTFLKTRRYDRNQGINRDYENIILTHYSKDGGEFPRTDSDDFYRRKEFGQY